MIWLQPLTDVHDNAWAIYDGDSYLGFGVVDDFGFVAFGNPQAFYFWRNPAF